MEKSTETLSQEIEKLQNLLELHESGVYNYEYSFQSIPKYEDALQTIKEAQKLMIKNGDAFKCSIQPLEKSPFIVDLRKVSLLAFNGNSDLVIQKVKYNNFENCEAKIIKTYEQINKSLASFSSEITKDYLNSKVKELAVGLEYELEKYRIKQEQDEIKAQMREEQKAIQEAEKKRDKAIEEENRLEAALAQARKEIEQKADAEREEFEQKIKQLEIELSTAHKEAERAVSNAQITSAGHVYIISNIGSFGENVYKIGMTRRDEPMDRVKELGDASVPFSFDVHAFIYSENARKLEADLHKIFTQKRVNKINKRKEFFTVSLEEIEVACKNLGEKIEFTRLAEAREFRESLKSDEYRAA